MVWLTIFLVTIDSFDGEFALFFEGGKTRPATHILSFVADLRPFCKLYDLSSSSALSALVKVSSLKSCALKLLLYQYYTLLSSLHAYIYSSLIVLTSSSISKEAHLNPNILVLIDLIALPHPLYSGIFHNVILHLSGPVVLRPLLQCPKTPIYELEQKRA